VVIGNVSLIESVIDTAHAATDFTGNCVHFKTKDIMGNRGFVQVEVEVATY
jgi:hypothetical protein